MNLREIARGKECMIRLPGICNFNPETTVLCHYSLAGESGRSIKSPDILGAWGCSECHRISDGGKSTNYTRDQIRLWFAEGCLRTIAELIRMEAI
jgi:hypothetical protein